jgi:nucleotide sugar dehydrogenase
MPGTAYLDSIINFWRVYSGHTEAAAVACEKFLHQIIDTKRFPLTRVATTTASEMGKVMENSYRATTIAFVEEWSRMAEQVGVDLFPVIDAIRVRPTHNNFRQPGFGVGGYCLTKDPLFGGIAARDLLDQPDLKFPMSELAVAINQRMPLESLRLVRESLNGSIQGKRILLLGISYRSDVGDTRHAPAEVFVRQALAEGASVQSYDPLLTRWEEFKQDLPATLPAATDFDAVVFTSGHEEFTQLDLAAWIGAARPLLIDGNRVFSTHQLSEIKRLRLPFRSIGRGTQP